MQVTKQDRENYLQYLLKEHEKLAKEEDQFNKDEANINALRVARTPERVPVYIDLPSEKHESVFTRERIIMEENAGYTLSPRWIEAQAVGDAFNCFDGMDTKGFTQKYVLQCDKTITEPDGRQILVCSDPYGQRNMILKEHMEKTEFAQLKGKLLLLAAYRDMEDHLYYIEKIDKMLLRV